MLTTSKATDHGVTTVSRTVEIPLVSDVDESPSLPPSAIDVQRAQILQLKASQHIQAACLLCSQQLQVWAWLRALHTLMSHGMFVDL